MMGLLVPTGDNHWLRAKVIIKGSHCDCNF